MKIGNNSPRTIAWMAWAIVCILGVTLPSAVLGQERSRERRDDERRDDSRQGRDRREDRDRHEERDRRDDHHARHDEDHIRFTRSAESRRFENGVVLREGIHVTDHRFDAFFPKHVYSYPHYAVSRASAEVVFSPFYFYFGVVPPYIPRTHVLRSPPTRVYIDIPLYVGNEYRGYRDSRDDYYLTRGYDERWRDNPEVKQAVYDLEDAFRNDDITLLSGLTDPGVKIAIFARGRYEYSLEPNDYLDMTRDFMRNEHTTGFDVYRVRYKSSSVYQVFVKHSYKNADGQSRMVYLCMVLERISGHWTLTQVDTSPDHLDKG